MFVKTSWLPATFMKVLPRLILWLTYGDMNVKSLFHHRAVQLFSSFKPVTVTRECLGPTVRDCEGLSGLGGAFLFKDSRLMCLWEKQQVNCGSVISAAHRGTSGDCTSVATKSCHVVCYLTSKLHSYNSVWGLKFYISGIPTPFLSYRFSVVHLCQE